VAYQITAEDLMAASMLSVRVIRYYALHVLDYKGREISGLLAQIPVDVKLADDRAEYLIGQGGPAWELWQLLHDIQPPLHRNRLGPVAAGKLLARKRPHLIPIYDSYVERVLGRTRTHGTWRRDLRCQLTGDAALVSELEAVRPRVRELPLPRQAHSRPQSTARPASTSWSRGPASLPSPAASPRSPALTSGALNALLATVPAAAWSGLRLAAGQQQPAAAASGSPASRISTSASGTSPNMADRLLCAQARPAITAPRLNSLTRPGTSTITARSITLTRSRLVGSDETGLLC
jgi:hypothetical protein